MECPNVDKVKPLDELLDDKVREFESGRDRVCDEELDTMIWELNDYENEEPPQDAKEFRKDTPTEEDLVEKAMKAGRRGRASFTESPVAAESPFIQEDFATASSIGSETGGRRTKAARKPRSRRK
jgi:hypothetical protein